MSAKLDTHAEIVKIAHLLDLEPAEVEYLATCDASTLVALRMQLIDLFYGAENSSLKRFAKVGNLLPTSIIASLTREAVGPVLAARIAGLVDPKQAAGVVAKLPPSFVVDVAIAIDPRRVEPVISRLDDETIEKLAFELVDREEYVVMGQFMGFAPEETLRAVFNYASDEALLRTAFVAEDKDRISVALAPQTDQRIASITRTAISKGLWPEAMDLFFQLSGEQYVRVINIAAKLSPTTLDKMITATTKHECWPALIPAISQMEAPDNATEALLRSDPENLRVFTRTVVEERRWKDIDALLGKLSDELAAGVIKTMLKYDVWLEAMQLVNHLSAAQHARVVNLAAKFSPGLLDKMVAATTHHDAWPLLVPVLARMKDPNRACEALLRGSADDVRGFATALLGASSKVDAAGLVGRLSEKNYAEMLKRLTRLKLADPFIELAPMLAA